jgi:hypothetical protein
MSLSDVGVPGQQIDVLHGGDVHPDGRLLSVAEIQQAYRDLRRAHNTSTEPGTTTRSLATPQLPHTSPAPETAAPHTPPAPEIAGPHTSAGPAEDPPHTSRQPDNSPSEGQTGAAVGGGTLGEGWIAVVAAHSGAGASCVALALADAFDAAGRPCRLIEAAHPARSGLVAAATAELGNDPSGAWRRGSRRLTTLYRRAEASAPAGWPDPMPDVATIIDLGLPAPANVARLVDDRPRIVVVCRVSVPGLRMAEQLLGELARACLVLAAVGPGRWPGGVLASLGPRVRELRKARRVVSVPEDRHLQVTGPTTSPLPKSVSHAGRELLGLIDVTASGSAGEAPHPTAPPASRQRGTTS